ncbi:MAG: hypothetical protein U9R73_14015 [Pseudomonadota bacterium]|nr:hypothetical protein [Pseudomonadota bacterium]
MARKHEYRIRAQRFLSGDFHVEDLSRLFLFLRANSFGAETVRDIGDMIGHADSRGKGLSLRRVNDTYAMTRFIIPRVVKRPDPSASVGEIPAGLLEAMEATLRLLDEEHLIRHTGMRKDQASTALTKLKRKVQVQPDGRATWLTSHINPADVALTRCLTSYIISKPAYSADDLFRETQALLLRHGFMDEQQIPLLFARRVHLALFAVVAMHGVRYRLFDSETAEAEAGWEGDDGTPRIIVSVTLKIPHSEGADEVSFPIFDTDLHPGDWSVGYDSTKGTAMWTVPLELTAEPRLKPLT